MNRPYSTSRSALLLSLCLALGLGLPAARAEVPLRAFTATYDLKKSGMHLAIAELSLAPVAKRWRWRLTTKARGIYAIFYNKKPFSETIFSQDRQTVRLQHIVIADEKDEEEFESVDFDWVKGQMKFERKGQHGEVALSDGVYDYQSIHLLAATMQLQQLEQATVRFYRKGKLVDSKLVYTGEATVTIDGKDIVARVYDQTISDSSTRTRYYYDAQNPLLPLLIETRKGDDKPTTLRLRKVDWQS